MNINSMRIVLVDDKEAFRKTLKLLLRKIGGNEVIAEAASGEQFLEKLPELNPDLVFMDIEMPGINGIETTRRALKINPSLLIVGLSLYDDKNYVDQLINAGAKGYILKLSDNYNLIETLIKYPKAEIFYSKEVDPNRERNSTDKRNILLFDDVESTRFVLQYTLQNEGFYVDAYGNFNDYLNSTKSINYHLIIADYLMPDINGLQILTHLKSEAGFKDVPSVLMSVQISDEILNAAKNLHVNSVLKKPFSVTNLILCVEQITL